MKPTIGIIMLILLVSTKYMVCGQPKEALPSMPQEKAFDMSKHQGTLAELRKKRHEQRLAHKELRKKPMPPIPEIEKPARGCSGCLSRTCKLVSYLFSYLTATTNNQD